MGRVLYALALKGRFVEPNVDVEIRFGLRVLEDKGGHGAVHVDVRGREREPEVHPLPRRNATLDVAKLPLAMWFLFCF